MILFVRGDVLAKRRRQAHGTSPATMTAIEDLRMKLQLEHQLKESTSAEEREWIVGELMKIDIALDFLEKELPSQPALSRKMPGLSAFSSGGRRHLHQHVLLARLDSKNVAGPKAATAGFANLSFCSHRS